MPVLSRKQMPLIVQTIWPIIRQTFDEFIEDKAPRLGAALSYYTVLSIAPLLVIVLGITGWLMGMQGTDPDESPVIGQFTGLIGGQGSAAIKDIVRAASDKPHGGRIATIVGIITLLIGASGVFGQLQDALNTIWEVAPRPGRGIWGFVRDRFLSFAMVGGVCFLLLASLMVSAGLAAAGHFMGGALPGMHYLWVILNFMVSLGVIAALFAMMNKVLPDVKVPWSDTWIGAIVTAALFGIGKWVIGMYLGKAGVGSAYGAAGSLVVLLVWVYYSSQIFLLGAEFTQVYSRVRGSNPAPASNAIGLRERDRIHEGIPHQATLDRAMDAQKVDATENGIDRAPDGRALVPVKGPRDGHPLASNALIIAGVYLGVKVVIPMTSKLGMALINRIAVS